MIDALQSGTRVALLVNECQLGLLDKRYCVIPSICEHAAARGIVPRIVALAAAFREAREPVIFIHMVLRADYAGMSRNTPAVAAIIRKGGLREGTADVEPVEELRPRAVDHVVRRYSGMTVFYGNHLDSLLRNLAVKTVVACGVSTNVAIPGIVLGALDRGFQVVVAEDCVAGTSAQAHDSLMTHLIRPLVTAVDSEEIIATLRTRSTGGRPDAQETASPPLSTT
jgi:nicotinamidase-related amidase